MEKIIKGIVDLIPPAWQYPEITCARIIIEDEQYSTANFKESKWKQARAIMVFGKQFGILEVYYLDEKPGSDEGPFLKEERNLTNALAERLGRIIERKKMEETMRKNEEKYRIITENHIDLIDTLDIEGIIQFVSPSYCRALGKTEEELIGTQFMDLVHEEDIKETAEAMEDLSKPPYKCYVEQRVKTKDG